MSDSSPIRRSWFHDALSADLGMVHRIEEYLYAGRSAYQGIEVIRMKSFGACLVLDGKIQSSEADEFVYHEALVHPAMITHPAPRTVLIAGGGEGATLREVLKHRFFLNPLLKINRRFSRCPFQLLQWLLAR